MTEEGQPGFSFSADSLQMYSILVNMGFQDDMCIKAAQKFPKNADDAINWIMDQQSKPNSQKSTTSSKPVQQPLYQQKNESPPGQKLQAWIIQNNLSKNITNALQQNDVQTLEDLKLLQTEQEITEFANDLGLKIIAKKKFISAVKKLNFQSQPPNINNNKMDFNKNNNSNIYGNSQIQEQKHYNSYQQQSGSQYNPYQQNPQYNPYQKQQKPSNINNQYKPQKQHQQQNYNPYQKQEPINQNPYSSNNNKKQIEVPPSLLHDNNDEKDDIKLSDEEIKKQKRQKLVAHLKGDVQVKYSLNKRSLDSSKKNRTILVIGATGTGKTTCLNSMMNYLWGVEYDDKFRYKLIIDSRKVDQSKSQTKSVTAYYLNPPVLTYSLTLVDTPGYGDTDGLTADDKITKKIRQFFDKEIQSIDAVCFVIRAPQARLTQAQKYVFNKILNVFGKDIKDNIFILLTFADGYPPPALAAIKKANIPFKKAFKLNNAGFFLHKDKNSGFDDDLVDFDDTDTDWKRGMRAFGRFFSELSKVHAKSLTLTRKVLSRREALQNYVCAIQPTIDKAYTILEEMRIQIDEINRNATIIDKSKDYTYQVEVTKSRRVDVESGLNTTTCTNCPSQFTCHNDCVYEDNADKKGCCAMNSNGFCTVCPNNCDWIHHKNLPYIVEFYSEKQTKTTKELRDRYVNAQNAQSASDQIIAGLTGDLVKQENKLQRLIENVRQCINELRKIALQPNIMSKDDYIDQLIEAEKAKRNRGWQSRVKTLQDLKKKDRVLMDVASGKFDNQFTNYNDVNQYLQQKGHKQKTRFQRQQPRGNRQVQIRKKKQNGFMDLFSGLF